MAPIKLKDGEITLYQRPDSENWYGGYRLPGGGRKQESLKTSNKELAVERALERYTQIHLHRKLGLSDTIVSFAEAADSWLEELAAEVAAGAEKGLEGGAVEGGAPHEEEGGKERGDKSPQEMEAARVAFLNGHGRVSAPRERSRMGLRHSAALPAQP